MIRRMVVVLGIAATALLVVPTVGPAKGGCEFDVMKKTGLTREEAQAGRVPQRVLDVCAARAVEAEAHLTG